MKKVLALVICVAMFACLAVTASAASDVVLTISSVEGNKGEVVKVDISISEKSNVGALNMDLTVDESVLKAVTTKNKKEQDVYFLGGDAATAAGALVEGSDGVVDGVFKLATTTTAGYWDAGVVWSVYFEIVGDLPAEGAVINGTVTSIGDCEDSTLVVNASVVAGKVTAPVEQPPVEQPPVDGGDDDNQEPETNEPEVEDEVVTDTDANPETGDVSGIAVAAGLCAVMAAAFVITKKVND